jgi:hypothetical protein
MDKKEIPLDELEGSKTKIVSDEEIIVVNDELKESPESKPTFITVDVFNNLKKKNVWSLSPSVFNQIVR